MNAVVGTLLIVVAALGFAVVMLVSRRPNPAAWSQHTLTHEIASISIVSLGGFGVAFVIQSISDLQQKPLTATHVITIALMLAVFAAVWVRLKVRKTLAEYARQMESASSASAKESQLESAGNVLPLSAGIAAAPEDPGAPPRPRTPRWRKKAA